MRRIYFDTNQLYYIRRITEESQGAEHGSYDWAYTAFPNASGFVEDIRALCYIVALQDEWNLDLLPSDASFAELCLATNHRSQATRDLWLHFTEGLDVDRQLRSVPFLPDWVVSGHLSLDFIDDPDDRVILRHFAAEKADVLLTSDSDILSHKARLAELHLIVMRPQDWLDEFLKNVRGEANAVDWIERVLYGIG
jgi:predicted nucleic acid-binding protein